MGAFCCPSVGQSIDEGRAEGGAGCNIHRTDIMWWEMVISWLRAQKEACSLLETDTINGTHLVTFSRKATSHGREIVSFLLSLFSCVAPLMWKCIFCFFCRKQCFLCALLLVLPQGRVGVGEKEICPTEAHASSSSFPREKHFFRLRLRVIWPRREKWNLPVSAHFLSYFVGRGNASLLPRRVNSSRGLRSGGRGD